MTTASRPPSSGYEVEVVAADLVARAAHRGEIEALDARHVAREQALLDLAGDLQLAVLPLLVEPHPVEPRALERGVRLARESRGEIEVLLGEGTARRLLADREEAAGPPARGEGHHEREARRRERVARGAFGQRTHRRRARRRGRLRRQRRRRFPGTQPARVREAQRAVGLVPVERAPRREELAHHRRGHEPLDRRLVEGAGQLAADVEEVVELEDLDRERPVDLLELLVDEPVLDRDRRARGEALEEAPLFAAERRAARPRAEPEERDRPAGAPHRADERDAGAGRQGLAGSGLERARLVALVPDRLGRAGRQRARRAQPEGTLGRDPQPAARDLQLAHHDQQRGVEDLAARERGAEGRREVQQRDELRHPLQQRGLAPLATELVERLLVLVDDRRRHGAVPAGLRLRSEQTLCRARRRKVTESMICPMRCIPRPPVRRSLA